MEYWDLLDAAGNPIGRTHLRGEPVPKGLYHRIVSVWTVDETDRLLLTLRAKEKESYPLYWENTAGSVLAGEESKEAAVRELLEETGLKANASDLRRLHSHFGNTTLWDTYFLRGRFRNCKIVLQPGETADARWCTMEELEEMIRRGDLAQPVVDRFRIVCPLLVEAMRATARG